MSHRIIEPRLLKGFRDTYPDKMLAKQYMIRTLESVLQTFGFGPLETPALEYADILLGKLGDEGEKLLYRFTDHGGREVAMRYDLTVPLARVVAQNPDLPKPFKRYQVGPVWRADNTQRGRYREFYQFDLDIVGTDSVIADAEVLVAMQQCLLALGIDDFVIRINDRRYLNQYAQNLKLDDQQKTGLFKALDKAEKVDWETTVTELQSLGLDNSVIAQIKADLFESNGDVDQIAPELASIITTAKTMGLADQHFKFDPTIVRGLDYYTGIVFETTLTKAAGYGSVFSGGRYDGLVELFSNQLTPAVGASIGVDRLIAALEELGLMPDYQSGQHIYVTVFNSDLEQRSLELVSQLRQAGIKAEVSYDSGNLGKQLKQAAARHSDFAIIVGPDEEAAGKATLRNMSDGTEQQISADQIIQAIK